MNSKALFTALVAACVAVALAAAQPSSAGPGKAKGKAKATAAPVKQGHGKANGHQSSSGHKAGKGHSDDGAAEQAAPQPVAPQPAAEGAGADASTESDVAVEEEPKNAAHACKAERGGDPEAFADTHGTNGNKRNAFGKCVSKRAHERNGAEDAEAETDAEEAVGEADESGDSDGTGTDTEPSAPETGAGESSVPDGADAHERQQEQLAELIERLEELLADLKAQLGEGAAPTPAAP
jgi:hypothetical protein